MREAEVQTAAPSTNEIFFQIIVPFKVDAAGEPHHNSFISHHNLTGMIRDKAGGSSQARIFRMQESAILQCFVCSVKIVCKRDNGKRQRKPYHPFMVKSL